jgi:hypothetical protein
MTWRISSLTTRIGGWLQLREVASASTLSALTAAKGFGRSPFLDHDESKAQYRS